MYGQNLFWPFWPMVKIPNIKQYVFYKGVHHQQFLSSWHMNQLLFNIKILHLQCMVWHYFGAWLLHGFSKKRSNFTVPGMCTWIRSLTSWCEQFPAFLCIAAAEPPRPHPDTSPSAHTQGHKKNIQLHSYHLDTHINQWWFLFVWSLFNRFIYEMWLHCINLHSGFPLKMSLSWKKTSVFIKEFNDLNRTTQKMT